MSLHLPSDSSPISRASLPDSTPDETKKASSLGQKAVGLLKAGVGNAIGLTGAAAVGVGSLVSASSTFLLVLAAPSVGAQSVNALHHLEEGFKNISMGEPMQQSAEIGKELDRGFNTTLLAATGIAVGGALILAGTKLAMVGDRIAG